MLESSLKYTWLFAACFKCRQHSELNFGLNLIWTLIIWRPYVVCASSEGSNETAHWRFHCSNISRSGIDSNHTGSAAIEKVNSNDEHGARIVWNWVFAICRPKTLFLAIFDPLSSIVKSVFDCRLSGLPTVIEASRKCSWWRYCSAAMVNNVQLINSYSVGGDFSQIN